MHKCLFALLFSQILYAQQPLPKYVSLADHKVFDVEIIIFAYKKALPNPNTYINKAIFSDSQALELATKPPHLLLLKNPDSDAIEATENNTAKEGLSIPLLATENSMQALTWFAHDKTAFKLTPIWDSLLKNEGIIPLIHKSWRQEESPFENPVYVKINNISPNHNDALSPVSTEGNLRSLATIYDDYSVQGMVAFSKGRFMHFSHRLNLFRSYQTGEQLTETKNMIFSLTERKQIKTDELHYFDSPWIGSIVKITEFTATGDKNEKTE
ncbi:MAG TPA: hypothetical protein ENJ41_01960 [Oceanospirillales bacterium]|nr:hypothetical protein [Oceanospirillales bacterium]